MPLRGLEQRHPGGARQDGDDAAGARHHAGTENDKVAVPVPLGSVALDLPFHALQALVVVWELLHVRRRDLVRRDGIVPSR